MKNRINVLYLIMAIIFLTLAASGASAARRIDMLIEGGTVLTMDPARTILQKGSVAVDRGAIVAVGPAGELSRRFKPASRIDARGRLVMPGLVNTHNHAAMTLFRGMADDMPLSDWLTKYIWPAEAKFITANSVRLGADLALAEMIRSGTTTFADMYFFAGETATASREAGMRAVIGEAVIDFKTPDSASPAESFKIIEGLAARWKNDPLITIAVSPHSPYTCSPETLRASRELAVRLGLPIHIHVAETQKEVKDLIGKYGQSPFEYLEGLGFLGENVLAVHSVYPSSSEIGLIAEKGVSVSHNPQSNMKLASGIAPAAAMLSAGIKFGLGTDGAASNNSLNMFKEMSAAAKLQKVSSLDPAVMTSRDVVAAATIGGARALGLSGRTGSIETGKKADIIIINLDQPHLVPMYDIYSHLVYAVDAADVVTSIIDGRIVMKDRKLLTLNEKQIMRRAAEMAARIRPQP